MKGFMRFRRWVKINPQIICPFKVLEKVSLVAYRLALSLRLLGVHWVFHVSMLKKYHGDGDYIIKWDSVILDKDFAYVEEPIVIFD